MSEPDPKEALREFRDQSRALPVESMTVIARQPSSLGSEIQSGLSNGSFIVAQQTGAAACLA
jgi:hypothetical protein